MLAKAQCGRSPRIIMALSHAPLRIIPDASDQIQWWRFLPTQIIKLQVKLNPEHHRIVHVTRSNDPLQFGQSLRGFFSPETHGTAVELEFNETQLCLNPVGFV